MKMTKVCPAELAGTPDNTLRRLVHKPLKAFEIMTGRIEAAGMEVLENLRVSVNVPVLVKITNKSNLQ